MNSPRENLEARLSALEEKNQVLQNENTRLQEENTKLSGELEVTYFLYLFLELLLSSSIIFFLIHIDCKEDKRKS